MLGKVDGGLVYEFRWGVCMVHDKPAVKEEINASYTDGKQS
jgi:hypothetical protein